MPELSEYIHVDDSETGDHDHSDATLKGSRRYQYLLHFLALFVFNFLFDHELLSLKFVSFFDYCLITG